MKVTRVRTYYVDPTLRKRRVYTFCARRTVKKEYPNIPGQRPRRTHWVRSEGYGHTPKKAEIALRKRPKRRAPREIKTKEDLLLNRRLVEKWNREHTLTPATRRKVTEWLIKKSKEETGG